MSLVLFLAVSAAILAVAYVVIGAALARYFHLSPTARTPAVDQRDGLDFEPARTSVLLPQHFSAIAAAGPVVGPILAALYFGWGPAWIWILLGGIFIGGIHDFLALIASVRHRGQSVAAIVREYMNPRAHVLFLVFVWMALIYVIIAFTDVTASTFVAKASVAGGDAPGPAVATSSVIYLVLALAMGVCLRVLGMNPWVAKLIFLPLVFGAIVAGPMMPLDIAPLAGGNAQMAWGYVLLAYCLFAAVAPVWLLLQPRGELGGYFLYIVMGIVVIGALVGAAMGGHSIEQPFFKGWAAPANLGGMPLMPVLFITVACGACSGFHSIIASGTTSKQLARETDARPVAYGSMLLESFFACISLATVMIVAAPAGTPNAIYAAGVADFARGILAPVWPVGAVPTDDHLYNLFYLFALLCFATFVFDTLDACTRLARYVLMEALGWTSRGGAVVATLATLVVPALVLLVPPVFIDGKPLPLWQVFWGIFGSSNQLLAALTLLGLTVWLAKSGRGWWIAFFPTVFMMTMTLWSLVLGVMSYSRRLGSADHPPELFHHLQFGITLILIVLSLWLIVEALITAWSLLKPPGAPGRPQHAEAPATVPA